MNKYLISSLEKLGYRTKVISSSHVSDAKNIIMKFRDEKGFSNNFFRIRLANFEYNFPSTIPNASSIIMIAVPTPVSEILFHWKDKIYPALLPPTYVFYKEISKKVGILVQNILETEKYHVAKTNLPLKILAAYSGLAKYGKNNITYISGMGSFYQLVGLFSDLPATEELWEEPQMMDRCKKCTACIKKCPTHAILSDRFLINAERCLAFYNEGAGEFPDWIKPEWHHCLFGCLFCQEVCPENKKYKKWIERACEFSNEETELFLDGVHINKLSIETREKLLRTELSDYYDILQRNLHLFIK